MNRCLAVIPAYNEEETIRLIINDLAEIKDSLGFDILVVNDSSTDRTGQFAKATGKARVIDLPCNLGIGGAFQTGFIYAIKHNYEIVFQFDADGQHRVEEIGKLLEPIRSGEADVVIGSRFLEKNIGFRSTWSRRLGIRILEHISQALIHQTITDCTSGFRAYKRKAIEFLAEHYPMDYPEPEAVILLGKNGFRMKEVLTLMNERQGGRSSISSLRSPYYMIKVSLGMIMTALRSPILNEQSLQNNRS